MLKTTLRQVLETLAAFALGYLAGGALVFGVTLILKFSNANL